MKNMLMCSCAEKWGDVAPLVLRVATGLIFFMHGWQKLNDYGVAGVTQMLTGLGFPAPELFAVVLIAAELVGGTLLILGLYTHWVAKILAFEMLIAWLTAHMGNGFYSGNGGYEFVMLLFASALALMIIGAGKYSLDHKWLRK